MFRSPDWYLVTDVSEQPVGPIFNRHAAPDHGGSLKSRSCHVWCRLRLKCDGTRAETRFGLSAKRMSPFKLAGVSVQSTTGSRGVRISGSNAGYTVFRGSVKSTGYPLHSPVSPSLPLPCITVCHHISTGLYQTRLCKLYGFVISKILRGFAQYSQQ